MKEFEEMKKMVEKEWISDYKELRDAVLTSTSGKVLHIATPPESFGLYRYRILKDGEQWKLVPMREQLDFLILTGYLQSSQGGSWEWEASEDFREQHISRAPFKPRIDVILSDVVIDINKKAVCAPDCIYYRDKDYSVVMRLIDDYWQVAVYLSSRSLIVSERAMRKEVFEQCRSALPILDEPEKFRQGRLSIEVFRLKDRDYERVERVIPLLVYHEGVMFYNHSIDALGYIRLDNEAIALPMLKDESFLLKIWSPDHIWEPHGFLAIESCSPFIARLTHPVPRAADCD